jgi:two-component system response regulator RegA
MSGRLSLLEALMTSRTILLGDPNESDRRLLARGFREQGFMVREAVDCRSVEALVVAERPWMVVLELRLADGFSVGLVSAVRDRGAQVAVVTGHMSVASALAVMRSGAAAYLEKPASARAILDAVEGRAAPQPPAAAPPVMTLDRAIWEYISRVFVNSGSVTEAARRLSLDRRSLRRMMARCAPR